MSGFPHTNSSGSRTGPGAGARFPKSLRLLTPRQFKAVYEARTRKSVGPLLVYARPNDVGHTRIGLSVGRQVGGAVARNRVKRLLREAFRLTRRDLPAGYDLVINVRGGAETDALELEDCQRLLMRAMLQLDEAWRKRTDKANRRGAADE